MRRDEIPSDGVDAAWRVVNFGGVRERCVEKLLRKTRAFVILVIEKSRVALAGTRVKGIARGENHEQNAEGTQWLLRPLGM
jgi:hypothetical protein